MDAKKFEVKLDGLLMLKESWATNKLFNQVVRDLAEEIAVAHATGADPVEVSRCLGGLQGCLAAQERWLQDEAERLILTGKAQRKTSLPPLPTVS